MDIQAEDPYCLISTFPCGPWGAWSRANLAAGGAARETVLQRRAEARPRPMFRLLAPT